MFAGHSSGETLLATGLSAASLQLSFESEIFEITGN